MVTVANTKIMVRPASKMLRAISFGVFWRSAPSTRAIMRSRKVDPCAAVMRTRIQSERTSVPPVTAERSPPDSRMTGADGVARLDQYNIANLQAGPRDELIIAGVGSSQQFSLRFGARSPQRISL